MTQKPTPPRWVTAWSMTAAFGVYFCVYGFRKPFTAGDYSGISAWGISCKTLFVTSQVFGYAISKFLGIKTIAEMEAGRRIFWLLGLVAGAELALLLFGLTPAPYSAFFLFLNGLPLGIVFGLIMGFLEGRRHTEAMLAGLCASFIVADGATKSVGAYLLELGFTESWMPFVAGLLFVPPLLLFSAMLSRVPKPSEGDVASRNVRQPMRSEERSAFFQRYAFGLLTLIPIYLLITVMRSVRADFAPQIWRGLGIVQSPSIFTISEIVVALAVLGVGGITVVITNHRHAFFGSLALTATGLVVVALALVGLQAQMMSPLGFMILYGMGLYIPYVLFHTTLFERLLALTRDRGNIGYLMYLADSFGYLGYVGVIVSKTFLAPAKSYLEFFLAMSWICVGMSALLLVPCWYYFACHPRTAAPPVPAIEPLGNV